MGSKLKYIKDSGYHVEEEFLDSLNDLEDIALKIFISHHIDSTMTDYPVNKLTTYVVGGVVFHRKNPVYFAIEILRTPRKIITLTDFKLIDVNEYLDLMNLNKSIKK